MIRNGVICPGCGTPGALIGQLQNCHRFAGVRFADPLPGGCLYRCPRCSLKFRNPVQDADAYRRLYDNPLTTAWASETARPDWDRIAAYVQVNFPQGGKVLDFGCYSGGLLHELGERYEKFGVEVNRAAASVAAEQNNAVVWQALENIPDGLRFDVIIAADVVEHVPNPQALLARLMQLLGDNGVLVLTTGDGANRWWNLFGANWWYCFIPEHISFISPAWLEYFSGENRAVVRDIEKFRYEHLSPLRLVVDGAMMILYGIAPALYLRLGSAMKRLIRRDGDFGPRGRGVSADHIFVVLANKSSTQYRETSQQ